MIGWYDKDGIPITIEEWGRLNADRDYSQIDRTKILDGVNPSSAFDVSTVWLGLDHGGGSGAPVIFETMVFAEGSSMDVECRRYCTEAEAVAGHVEMVAYVASELRDPIVMDL